MLVSRLARSLTYVLPRWQTGAAMPAATWKAGGAVLGALLALGGCAFTNVPLDMPISGLATPIGGGKGRKVVVVRPFADQRPQPNRCGMQKNGYNQDTADAVCRLPPDEWIAGLLADELRAAGFTVLPSAEGAASDVVTIEGALLQLFVEPIAGAFSVSCEADFQVRLDVTSKSGLRASRTFFVKGVWKGFSGVTGPFQVALKRATDGMLEETVTALIELLDRYPQLGAAPPAMRFASLEAACVP
jgi:hypothetical protein